MPRWARLCTTALTGGCLALAGLCAIVWWRTADRSRFWPGLAELAAAPQGPHLLLLFVLLMAAVVSLTRFAAAGGLPAPVAAPLAGLAVPLAYVLGLLTAWARSAAALAFVLRLSWIDIGLFCLPFVLAAPLSAWLWDRLPPAP